MSEALFEQGIHVDRDSAADGPAGSARLRITLSAAHELEHIDRLIEALQTARFDRIGQRQVACANATEPIPRPETAPCPSVLTDWLQA